MSRALVEAENITVVAHIKPDADAVGSACALASGLRRRGKRAEVRIGQTMPHAANLAGIPGVGDIVYGHELPTAGLVVTVDCASVDRTGAFSDALAADPARVIVVDHHATNPRFGGLNLIARAESTTMMVRELLSHMGVALDRDLAHCLYAGLVTDTGNFRWGTKRMHVLAAELTGLGLDTRSITLELMDSMTPSDLVHLGNVLAGMQICEAGGHRVGVFTIGELSLRAMSQTAVETVIDYARSVSGCDIGVVLKQQAQTYWSVSLRSNSSNVAVVAEQLGGGGHVPAAGLSAHGTREAVIDRVLAAIR